MIYIELLKIYCYIIIYYFRRVVLENRQEGLNVCSLISNQLTINNNFLSKASLRSGLIYAKNEAFAEQQ